MEHMNSAPTTPRDQIISNRSFFETPPASQTKVNSSSKATRALAQAFPQVNAATMLSNLHRFLGSKHNYSIAGSAALFIHACLAPNEANTLPTKPNDLDVVVNYAGLTRSEYLATSIQELGFVEAEMHPGRYHYTDPANGHTVDVDLIPDSRHSFGRFLRDAQWAEDFQLAKLDDLLEAAHEQIGSNSLSVNGVSAEKKALVQTRLNYFNR